MIELFVFDLDDTLYPEIDYVASGFRAVASTLEQRNCCRRDHALSLLWKAFWLDRRHVFDQVLSAMPKAGFTVEELIQHYRKHQPNISLRDGMAELLSMLSQGAHTAILTDGPVESQRMKVQALGLERSCGRIIFTDLLGPGAAKPSTLGFRLLLDEYGVEPGRAVYIADNPQKDFLGPNSLGMLTIRLDLPDQFHRTTAAPPGGNAGIEIRSLPEFHSLLNSMASRHVQTQNRWRKP